MLPEPSFIPRMEERDDLQLSPRAPPQDNDAQPTPKRPQGLVPYVLTEAAIATTNRRSEMFSEPLTWTCHVCKEERPDALIAVATQDTSQKYGLPIGTMKTNVRYCRDRPSCIAAATAPDGHRFLTG